MGGLPGGGMAVGGGGLGLVGIVVYLLIAVLGGGSGGAFSGLDGLTAGQPASPDAAASSLDCTTGADANTRQDCRIVGDVNSIQKYWGDYFRAHNKPYELATTVFFTGSTQTRCGAATTDVGPFYCPVDKHVYIDLGFFQELKDRFGAQGGPFAEAYVLAHEYGHHAQDLFGDLQTGGSTGAQGRSVRTELQADCYAGVWAHSTDTRGKLQQGDVDEALNAASSVGDDRIQQQQTGRINVDSFTHGSAAQRSASFKKGFDSGDPRSCDISS
jgi:uncharacterized protein